MTTDDRYYYVFNTITHRFHAVDALEWKYVIVPAQDVVLQSAESTFKEPHHYYRSLSEIDTNDLIRLGLRKSGEQIKRITQTVAYRLFDGLNTEVLIDNYDNDPSIVIGNGEYFFIKNQDQARDIASAVLLSVGLTPSTTELKDEING